LYDGTHYTDWAYDVVARKMTAAIKNFYWFAIHIINK
jgi:hypothetical protein